MQHHADEAVGRMWDRRISQQQCGFDSRLAMKVVRERRWLGALQPHHDIRAGRIDGRCVHVAKSVEQFSTAGRMRCPVLRSHDDFELIEEFPFSIGVSVKCSAGTEADELLVAISRSPCLQVSPALPRGGITVGPKLSEGCGKLQAEQCSR